MLNFCCLGPTKQYLPELASTRKCLQSVYAVNNEEGLLIHYIVGLMKGAIIQDIKQQIILTFNSYRVAPQLAAKSYEETTNWLALQ